MHKKRKLLPYIMTAAAVYICIRKVIQNRKQLPDISE